MSFFRNAFADVCLNIFLIGDCHSKSASVTACHLQMTPDNRTYCPISYVRLSVSVLLNGINHYVPGTGRDLHEVFVSPDSYVCPSVHLSIRPSIHLSIISKTNPQTNKPTNNCPVYDGRLNSTMRVCWLSKVLPPFALYLSMIVPWIV